MSLLTNLLGYTLQKTKSLAIINLACVRYKSKNPGSSNNGNRRRPKHRGWKVQDGHYVRSSTILATQLRPRFHPGLYVGMGRNGTLYALEHGKVMVTCEKMNPNMNHSWVKKNYAGREDSVIYKKYFNVIPEPHHDKFVIIDKV